jgi:hypothetical protein
VVAGDAPPRPAVGDPAVAVARPAAR